MIVLEVGLYLTMIITSAGLIWFVQSGFREDDLGTRLIGIAAVLVAVLVCTFAALMWAGKVEG
jgi:preprotein translocase subunit Sec61beta